MNFAFTVLPRRVVELSCGKLAFTDRDFGTDFHSMVKIGRARWGNEDRRLVDFCLSKPHFNSVSTNKSLIMLNSWPINKALVFLWWRFPTLAGLEIPGMGSTGHHCLMLVKRCLGTPAHRLCSGDFSLRQKHRRGSPGTLLTKLGYSAVHW